MKSGVFILSFLLCSKFIHSFSIMGAEEEMKQKEISNKDNNNKELVIKEFKTIVPTKSDYIVGGLETDELGNLLIFHRGSRVWGFDSFDFRNNFNTRRYGAIKENVLDIVDPSTNDKLASWGKGKFYMPHGITLDQDENLWLTDVATHQVYKYNLIDNEPLLTLGEKFVNGNDESHFCKPTDVAVSWRTNDIFVSDGYCNRRIVQFNENGEFIREFVDNDKPLIVAHSIALIEEIGIICTVSREDGRIVCFDVATGDKKHEIKHKDMNTVYAIEYDSNLKVLHAVTGNSPANGFTFAAGEASNFGDLVSQWVVSDLDHAHDIAISPQSSHIYLGSFKKGTIKDLTVQIK